MLQYILCSLCTFAIMIYYAYIYIYIHVFAPMCYTLFHMCIHYMCDTYTLCLFNIAMENGPFIDGLPIKNCDFPWLC